VTTQLQREYRGRAVVDHDIWQQLPVLYAWARHPGARIIELGVRSGNSTSAFLAGAEQSGGELWSVDVAEPDIPAYWRDLPFWHLLVADDTAQEAVAHCPDGADVLFIDTSHFYEHTLLELRLYAGKVRPGGVVLMHDTDRREWPDVSRALDDFCGANALDWYDHPWWHGLGVIEVPRA
jgi:predicted O-methyltransferase YrrM